MAITVVCPGCHGRFQVSEKFAGKQGPCPKCKEVINIPALGDEVQVHEPEFGGPGAKDAKGKSVLKPLERVETKVQPVVVVGVIVSVLLAFALAFVLRMSDPSMKSSIVVLALGAAVMAPPLVLAGYTFLRNQELEPYRGMALAARVAICSVVYAGLWAAVWAIKHFFVGDSAAPETWQYLILLAPPILVGALAAFSTLDLDFGSGAFHYCLYLGVCVLLRVTMGLPML